YLFNLFRPLMDVPMVPIKGEAVHCDHVDGVQHSIRTEQGYKVGIDGRDATQGNTQRRIFTTDRRSCSHHHLSEDLPVGIELEVPVRQVVRLVPEHYRFYHASSQKLYGWARVAI